MPKKRESTPATPEEFEFETRLVVLNALGLVPSAIQPNVSFASSCVSEHAELTHTSSSSSESPRSLSSSRDGATLRQVLPTLPETSLAEKLDEYELSKKEVSPASITSPSPTGYGYRLRQYEAQAMPGDELETDDGDDCVDGVHKMLPERPNSIPLRGLLRRTDPVEPTAYPFDVQAQMGVDETDSAPLVNAGHPELLHASVSQYDRQNSEISESSFGSSEVSSLMQSKRSTSSRSSRASNRVDIQHVDVQAMVKSHVLPPVAVPLREEINQEMSLLERNFEDAVRSGRVRSEQVPALATPSAGATTPETEVARWLGMIGDQVQEEYGGKLQMATQEVLSRPREEVSYDVLRQMTEELLSQTSGWTRVALVLLFSQKISLGLLARGERGLHELVEYTSKILMDQTADFILSRGGWNAIWEIDRDSPSPAGTGGFSPSLEDMRPGFLTDSMETVLPGAGTMTDSAISSGLTATLDPALAPITRDDTMHSIASIANSELATPATEPAKDLVDGPNDPPAISEPEPMTAERREDLESSASSKSQQDSGVAAAESGPTSKRDSVPSENTRDIVDRLQPEIRVLRQASIDMSNKAVEDKERYSRTVVWLTATGCALVAISAIFLYKKLKS